MGIEVVRWDERLTSVAAERAVRDEAEGEAGEKDRLDPIAACLLLQAYLDSPSAIEPCEGPNPLVFGWVHPAQHRRRALA